MKFLKKVLMVLVAIILLITIVSIFLPGSIVVKRSRMIAAPKETLFNLVGELKNWNKWSPFYEKDTAAVYVFSPETTGKGAWYTWKGNKNVGEGKLTIADVYGTDSLFVDLDFMGRGKGKGGFMFVPKDGGTEVTWTMASDFPFIMRIMGLFMDGMLGPDFEKGLEKMEKVVKEMPAQSAETFPVIETTPKIYLTVLDSASGKDISAKFAKLYGKLGDCMEQNKLKMAGPPSAFYYKNTFEMMVFEAAIAVDAEPKNLCKGITVRKTIAQKAVAYDYYGDYSKMFTVYERILPFMAANKMERALPYFEEYVTDPMSEKDTAKWLTKIFIPIK